MPDAATGALTGVLPAWLDDIVVDFGPVSAALAGETASGVLWSAAPGQLSLEVPGVARYLSAAGQSLTIDWAPGAELETIARFARTTPLAALCYQRGMSVLHAATAVNDGWAVILAGDSASGKSTLLAALLARGWSMLGDEVAPLTVAGANAAVVFPSGAEVRLWPDAIARLERDPGFGSVLARDAAGARYGARPVATGDRALVTPTAIGSIWQLSLHNEPRVRIEAMEGFERFDSLGKLAYNGRIAHALLDRGAHLRIAAAIAASVPLRHAWRPRGSSSIEQLADAIERDAGDRPGWAG